MNMHKKILILITCILTIIALSGCDRQKIIEVDRSEFVIYLDIDSIEDDVYRLDLVYFLEEEFMGGVAVSHADQSPLEGPVYFHLDHDSFPEGSSREDFKFYIVVSGDRNGINDTFSSAEIMDHSNDSDVFNPQYGSLYAYRLKGSFEEGFTLERNTAE